MSNTICFLITLLNSDETLLRCAVKLSLSDISDDVVEYPLEPENRQILRDLLPPHIGSVGPVVQAEQIFDVCVIERD